MFILLTSLDMSCRLLYSWIGLEVVSFNRTNLNVVKSLLHLALDAVLHPWPWWTTCSIAIYSYEWSFKRLNFDWVDFWSNQPFLPLFFNSQLTLAVWRLPLKKKLSILLHTLNVNKDIMLELIFENASTKCKAVSVNSSKFTCFYINTTSLRSNLVFK